MKNTNDLKEIWKQNESTTVPPIQEVTNNAKGTIRKIRNKLFFSGFLVAATLGFIIYQQMRMQNEMLTTKIGLTIMSLGIVLYLIVSNSILNMFLKNEFSTDSITFLDKTIELKNRLEVLYKTITTIYFIALSAGLVLALIEQTMSESLLHMVLTYGLSLGWIAFAWFVLRPREMKKLYKLTDSIHSLQNMRNQFAENK
jgi:uncharacterized membrane protein YciS (DUF1049 family)